GRDVPDRVADRFVVLLELNEMAKVYCLQTEAELYLAKIDNYNACSTQEAQSGDENSRTAPLQDEMNSSACGPRGGSGSPGPPAASAKNITIRSSTTTAACCDTECTSLVNPAHPDGK
ncbi:unnamed protein product, partial [Amoebophrya sp. A120]